MDVQTIYMKDGSLYALDQTRLPHEEAYIKTDTLDACRDAIKRLCVRGAPLIGVYAAYALCVCHANGEGAPGDIARALVETRPTAVNLAYAVGRVLRFAPDTTRMLEEARALEREDIASNAAIGAYGSPLLHDGDGVLTHCNAGALATAGIGTALGVIVTAHRAGTRLNVYADETRPLLQGARLTAYELRAAGVPVTLICDNMAGWLMKQGRVQCCIVGADRIARNGDAANKIGTYGLAVLARAHGVPFYVAAPISTLDAALPTGADIPIEQRDAREVTHIGGVRVAADVPAYNPAFDVTDAALISAIITDKGVFRSPYDFR